ncbi:MAG: L-serine ammonia-lyase, iron-sulfur-dependent subunit beta [Lachnospiraceae bacterium]|nr:L-serine ammonia-lyase, iron-sulfur-dependent subunit beta [Lachnospiraceae bacterium]
MSVFDILGPVMVGPSSSHTAGAVRIGYVTRVMLAEEPVQAHIQLHGSFAATGKGHGTDTALIAGLLGMKPSDMNVPKSFEIAREKGLQYSFENINLRDAHPNTVVINVKGKGDRCIKIQASSIGGGRIMINRIDDIEVNFSGENNTLIVHNRDIPGNVSRITSLLAANDINIATMQLYRHQKGGFAVMILETDQDVPQDILNSAGALDGIIKVTYLNAVTV